MQYPPALPPLRPRGHGAPAGRPPSGRSRRESGRLGPVGRKRKRTLGLRGRQRSLGAPERWLLPRSDSHVRYLDRAWLGLGCRGRSGLTEEETEIRRGERVRLRSASGGWDSPLDSLLFPSRCSSLLLHSRSIPPRSPSGCHSVPPIRSRALALPVRLAHPLLLSLAVPTVVSLHIRCHTSPPSSFVAFEPFTSDKLS